MHIVISSLFISSKVSHLFNMNFYIFNCLWFVLFLLNWVHLKKRLDGLLLSFDMFARCDAKKQNFLNCKLVIHTSLLSKIYWTCPCWIYQYKIEFPLVTCTSLLESICWIWPLINWRSYSSNFYQGGNYKLHEGTSLYNEKFSMGKFNKFY